MDVAAAAHAPADRKLAAAIFLVVFVGYGWFFNGGGWNQNASFDLTRALVESRTIAIDAYHANTGDVSEHGGRVYANKAPGLGFLAAIPYAAIYGVERAAGLHPDNPLVLTLAAWLVTVVVCGVPGALIASMLYLAGRRRGKSPRWSLAVAMLVALGTPLFAFGTILFAHVPNAMLILSAFLWAAERRRPFAAGAALGLATAVHYVSAPLLVLFALAALRDPKERRWPYLLRWGGGAAIPLILLAAYQFAAFGSPLVTSIERENPMFKSESALLGIFVLPSPAALWGITGSVYRGLFWLSPILLLAGLGAWRIVRTKGRRIEAAMLLGAIALFFVTSAAFNFWAGGATYAPRYLIPIIPLIGVLLLESDAAWTRAAAWPLGAVSLANNAVATFVDPQVSDLVKNPLFDYLYPLFLRGRVPEGVIVSPSWPAQWLRDHVAVNAQTMGELYPFFRFPPDTPPAIWASFNLGEILFGAGSALSVVPIVLWAATGWLLLARKARGERRDLVEKASVESS